LEGGVGEKIFHCGIFGHEFGRKTLFGDVFGVFLGETVTVAAKRAEPPLRLEIDLAVGVEKGLAFAAGLGSVFDEKEVFDVLHGGVGDTQGDLRSGKCEFVGRKHVPGHTVTISSFLSVKIHSEREIDFVVFIFLLKIRVSITRIYAERTRQLNIYI